MDPGSPKTRRFLFVTLTVIVLLPLLFSVLLASCRSSLNVEEAAHASSVVDGAPVVVQAREIRASPELEIACYQTGSLPT